MKKSKSIVLLSIISAIMAVLLVFSFVRFSVGTKDYKSFIGAVSLDYDLEGGVSYTLTLNKENENEVDNIESVMNTISSRMIELGYQTFEVSAFKDANTDVKDYSIRISAKNKDTIANDITAVAAYGEIKFYGGTTESPSTEIMNEKKAVKTAKYVGPSTTDGTTTYLVGVEFTDYGYKTLVSEIENAGDSTYYLRIALGNDDILNGSITKDSISGKTVYIQTGSEDAGRQTAMQVRTGGLPYLYDVSESVTANPVYGNNASLYAGIVMIALLVAIIVAMIVLFAGYGIISSLSIICFALIFLAMLIAVPGITVSLAGVFGIGLATILCADGLFIIIKRIREEFALGKTLKASVKAGYKRALMPILTSNLIALAGGLLLFAFAKGTLVSFAITLSIGVVISFVSTILISRMFTALILPLVNNKEKFLNLKRVDK